MDAEKDKTGEDEKNDERMKIKLIKKGIVIDHITHGRALEVLRILGIGEDYEDEVSLSDECLQQGHGQKRHSKSRKQGYKRHMR